MEKIRWLFLLMTLFSLPTFAQIENEVIDDGDNESVSDSAMVDTLFNDSISLPWPENVQYRLRNLLKSDIFETSQVGLMVYDLDADSTLCAYND